MKKLLFKLSLLVFTIVFTFVSLFMITLFAIPPQFAESYQYVINDKYKNLTNQQSPKIISIGGSSFAFGINPKLIKEKMGYECVNLGLHGGFGAQFQTEIAKGNISKGDIVVIAYEYSEWEGRFGAELVVTGIDNNVELYKYIPRKYYISTMKYLPTYFFKKLNSAYVNPLQFNGFYKRSSFDSLGNLTLDRPKCIITDQMLSNTKIINKALISDEIINYVNDFNDYVKSKGALLLISFPPLLDKAIVSSENEILEFEAYLDEKLNAPVISSIDDYILEKENFFDTVYHLNNSGEIKRTELLIRDINKYLKNN